MKTRPVRNPNRPPTHPGALLRLDVLPALDLTQDEAAQRLGVSRVSVSQVLNEHRAVTATMAVRIERELNVSAELLLSMQQALDLWKARREQGEAAPELAHYTAAKREASGAIALARITSSMELQARPDGEPQWTNTRNN